MMILAIIGASNEIEPRELYRPAFHLINKWPGYGPLSYCANYTEGY